MKQVEIISENRNHTAISIGSLDKLTDYSFIHPKTGKEVTGKVFVKEATDGERVNVEPEWRK